MTVKKVKRTKEEIEDIDMMTVAQTVMNLVMLGVKSADILAALKPLAEQAVKAKELK